MAIGSKKTQGTRDQKTCDDEYKRIKRIEEKAMREALIFAVKNCRHECVLVSGPRRKRYGQ